jgi:hypothetical protein
MRGILFFVGLFPPAEIQNNRIRNIPLSVFVIVQNCASSSDIVRSPSTHSVHPSGSNERGC